MTVIKLSLDSWKLLKCTEAAYCYSASQRQLHMPCRQTTNKAATWTVSKLPRYETDLTDNIRIISRDKNVHSLPASSLVDRPMIVILEWLMAKKKHIHKFSDIYLKYGFDVMSVKIKPWQVIWPVKGSQVVAGSLLELLNENYNLRPLMLHGFSVGGYFWGEVQVKMVKDMDKYQQLRDNITGAIWDSAVDVTEIADGVPAAVFPKNAMLRSACKKYIQYHMKAFEKEATQHWVASRGYFYRPLVTCPALLLYSNTDPLGNKNAYSNVRKSYESMGITIYEKCWDKSPHVAHFAFHREEYTAQVELFMQKIGLISSAELERAAAVN